MHSWELGREARACAFRCASLWDGEFPTKAAIS